MRIYIASHDAELAERLAGIVDDIGHEVTSSWHSDPTAESPLKDDHNEWERFAAENFAAIAESDMLVMISSPHHISGEHRVPGGKFVEAGYALGLGKRVVTAGGVENGMLCHPHIEHVTGDHGLIKLLAPANPNAKNRRK